MAIVDWEEFRASGKLAVDFVADYYRSIADHPVKSDVSPGYLKV